MKIIKLLIHENLELYSNFWGVSKNRQWKEHIISKDLATWFGMDKNMHMDVSGYWLQYLTQMILECSLINGLAGHLSIAAS